MDARLLAACREVVARVKLNPRETVDGVAIELAEAVCALMTALDVRCVCPVCGNTNARAVTHFACPSCNHSGARE